MIEYRFLTQKEKLVFDYVDFTLLKLNKKEKRKVVALLYRKYGAKN